MTLSFSLLSESAVMPDKVLLAIQEIAADHGAVSIALHVFAHNEVAQRLYRDAGYEISGYLMPKCLDDAGS